MTDADYRPSRSFADRQDRAPAEYDEYEGADDFDNEAPPSRRTTLGSTSRAGSRPQPPPKSAPKVDKKPIEKPKEVNLFDFDDDDTTPAAQVGDGKSFTLIFERGVDCHRRLRRFPTSSKYAARHYDDFCTETRKWGQCQFV